MALHYGVTLHVYTNLNSFDYKVCPKEAKYARRLNGKSEKGMGIAGLSFIGGPPDRFSRAL